MVLYRRAAMFFYGKIDTRNWLSTLFISIMHGEANKQIGCIPITKIKRLVCIGKQSLFILRNHTKHKNTLRITRSTICSVTSVPTMIYISNTENLKNILLRYKTTSYWFVKLLPNFRTILKRKLFRNVGTNH